MVGNDKNVGKYVNHWWRNFAAYKQDTDLDGENYQSVEDLIADYEARMVELIKDEERKEIF